MPQGSKLLLRCGLMPFGAWAASAASSVHEPGIAPEASSILQLLDCSSPAPWMGLSSLVELAAKLTAALDEIKAMGVHIDAGIMLSPLVNKLVTAPECSGFGAWGGLVLRAQSALGRWNNHALPAGEALSSVVSDLKAV